jgi:hypothetical protein
MAALVLFTVVHTALVPLVHARENIASIVLGGPTEDFLRALIVAVVALPPSWSSTSGRPGIRCAASAASRSSSTRSRRPSAETNPRGARCDRHAISLP